MIGILAGMGPKSTAPFIEKVVELCQRRHGAQYDMDFPPMMIYSCPTPFYLDRPLDHPAMQEAIVAGAGKLVSCGVDYLAIPCNLAHIYYEYIQKSVSIPILNIVDETIKMIPTEERKITVLATPSTIEAKIYQQGLLKFDKEFVFEPCWQDTITDILHLIKGGKDLEEAKFLWDKLLHDVNDFASVGIVACTDLNVVADTISSRMLVIDSSTCLATAVVDNYYSKYRCNAKV